MGDGIKVRRNVDGTFGWLEMEVKPAKGSVDCVEDQGHELVVGLYDAVINSFAGGNMT